MTINVHARQLTTLGAWLITIAVGVPPVWGEPLPLLALARVGIIASSTPAAESPATPYPLVQLNALEAMAVGAPAAPDPPTLTTSVADKGPTDLRLLLGDGERWRLMEFGAAATWRPLEAKLTAFGQLPYVATGRPDAAPALDAAHEPASLGVRGQIGDFEAGAQYRSVGKRLDRLIGAPPTLRDREGHEMWVAQRFGLVKLRLSDSELTDNVDRNPALPRTTKDQSAITAELSVADWPVFALTYAVGDSARVRLTPRGREGPTERYAFESVTGSAYYYGGPAWDVIASSTLAQSRPDVRPDEQMATTSQELIVTLRLLDSVTAVPAISLWQERDTRTPVRTDTGTAGVTVSYAPKASRWSASTFASYTSTRTSDGSTHGRSVSLGGAVNYALGRLLPARSALSFEAGYDRYDNAVVPASSSHAISGFVLLKIAGF